MKQNSLKALVVYSSPAGTTRHIAKVISETLKEEGWKQKLIDFEDKGCDFSLSQIKDDLEKKHCLWIGSPVYA